MLAPMQGAYEKEEDREPKYENSGSVQKAYREGRVCKQLNR